MQTRGETPRRDNELVLPSVAVRGKPALRAPGRLWMAAALVTLSLASSAWFSFVQMPLAIAIEGVNGSQHVASIGIGSDLWRAGIRAGSAASMEADGTVGLETVTSGDTWIPLQAAGGFPETVALALVLILAALLVRAARLPGSAALAGAGVAFALGPVLPEIGLPGGLPLVLLSLGTAISATAIPDRRLQRWFDASGLVIVGLVTVGAVLLMREMLVTNWDFVWGAPLMIAVAVALAGEGLAVAARLRQMPLSKERRSSRFLRALVPLAARSRIEGADEERSRLAIELHNSVMPKVRSSARAVRADANPEEAAQHIESLEAELRDVMTRYETVTLELGGIADALRVFVEGLDTGGIRVLLDTSKVGAKRPPANVEMAAYRIGQAAIDNAIRHSSADLIEITVASRADSARLTVKDDGVGIDPPAEGSARHRGRLGIAQMRVRAEAVGGNLDVAGRPGEGTEVRFTWAG